MRGLFLRSMNDPQPEVPASTVEVRYFPAASRVSSLDSLRGFALLGLLIAGSLSAGLDGQSGGAFVRRLLAELSPVAWRGFHAADVFAPLFVFVSGISLVLSLRGFTSRYGKDAAFLRVARRSFWLYVLGFFCAGGFASAQSGVPLLGGLQRVALCHGICGFGFIFFRARTLVLCGVIALAAYCLLLGWYPTAPVSTAADARWMDGSTLVHRVDARVLPHLNASGNRDSFGLLTIIPSCAVCLLGVAAGTVFVRFNADPSGNLRRLAMAGAGAVGVGLALSVVNPIIPRLWTPSYVLIASGISLLLLLAFHLAFGKDRRPDGFQPLIWMGTNSVAIYTLARLIDLDQLAARFLGGNAQALLNRELFGVGGTVLVALLAPVLALTLAGYLYRQRLYLRP